MTFFITRPFLLLLTVSISIAVASGADEKEGESSQFHLKDVVVTGTKTERLLKNVPVETSIVTEDEWKDAAGFQSVADVIRWLPGVNISGGAQFGSTHRFTTVIRGMPTQYTLVLVDGERMKSEHIHTGVNLSLVPLEMVSRIELIKGPASALYGSDAFGGVINILSKPMITAPPLLGNVSYGTFNTKSVALNHAYYKTRWGYMVTGKWSDSDGYQDSSPFATTDLLARFEYRPTDLKALRVRSENYWNRYMKGASNVLDQFHSLGISWEHGMPNQTEAEVGLFISEFDGNYRFDHNQTFKLEFEYEWILKKQHAMISGLEIKRERFSRTATPLKSEWIGGGFIQDEAFLWDRIQAEVALRFDVHPENFVISPQAAILYQPLDETNVRLAVGRGFRAPSLQDRYEYHYFHSTYWRDGNPDLLPEYSTNINMGVEQEFMEKTLWGRLSLFRNELTNMIIVQDTGAIDDGWPVMQRENIGEAYTQGIEMELRYNREPFSTILGFTILDTQDDQGRVVSYNPRYFTALRIAYDEPRWGIGGLLSIEDVRERFYLDKDGFVQQLSDYSLINISLSKTISSELQVKGTIGNIFNQEFETYEEGKAAASFGRTFTLGMKFRIQ